MATRARLKVQPGTLILLFLLVIYTDLFLVSVGLFAISPTDRTFDRVTIVRLLAIITFTCFVLFKHLPAIKDRHITLTTMATVGYGDIHPLNQPVRLWLTAQIIIGVAFVGFIIQRELMTAQPKKRKR